MKAKHVMVFEELDDWHNIVNYNNFFRIKCDRWLNRQQFNLGGFDGNGMPMYDQQWGLRSSSCCPCPWLEDIISTDFS